MSFAGANYFCAVLLVSKQPAKLADFYKNVLKVPLDDEEHDGQHLHYGCEIGDLHFAIHPVENFDDQNYGVGSVKLAFEIFDMDGFVAHAKAQNVELLYPPKPMGTSKITAIKDPDGNLIELTQLSDGWFQHIEKRRAEGKDMLVEWKNRQK